jgi:hypothetical protein
MKKNSIRFFIIILFINFKEKLDNLHKHRYKQKLT